MLWKASWNCLIWRIKRKPHISAAFQDPDLQTVTIPMAVLQTSSMSSGTLCKEFHHLRCQSLKEQKDQCCVSQSKDLPVNHKRNWSTKCRERRLQKSEHCLIRVSLCAVITFPQNSTDANLIQRPQKGLFSKNIR